MPDASNPTPLIGSVFERSPTARMTHFQPLGTTSGKTGFPAVKHRSEHGISKGRSAFMKSRDSTGPKNARPPTVVREGAHAKQMEAGRNDIDWRSQMSRANDEVVASMTEQEREEARQTFIQQFGDNLFDVLKKKRELEQARLSVAQTATGELEAVPVAPESSSKVKSRPKLGSPPRPSLTSSINNSRPSTPTKSARKLRFAEITNEDVFVYESAPPSPRLRPLFALPPPTPDESDVVSLGSLSDASTRLQPQQPSALSETVTDEGTPEDIRRRFFPSAPSDNPDIAWMSTSQSASDPGVLRFDLAGRPLNPSQSSTLPSHLGLHHHAEGFHAGYSLDDIFVLARSTVPGQRSAMLGILKGIVVLLTRPDRDDGPADPSMTLLLDQVHSEAAEILKKILFVALEAIPEHGTVGSLAVELLWECTRRWDAKLANGVDMEDIDELEYELGFVERRWSKAKPTAGNDTTQPSESQSLIPSLPLTQLLPEIRKILTAPPDAELLSSTIPHTPAQNTLLLLLCHISKYTHSISEAIVETQELLPTVLDVFVYHPDLKSTNVVDFFISIACTSRVCARAIVDAGAAGMVLKLVGMALSDVDNVVLHTPREDPEGALRQLTQSLRLFTILGRYGLANGVAVSAQEIWRRVGSAVCRLVEVDISSGLRLSLVRSWSALLEVWITCAVDPHLTTPDHALLWSHVQAWAWTEDLLSLALGLSKLAKNQVYSEELVRTSSAVWGAISAWLEGSQVNGIRGGEKEKAEVLAAFQPRFDSGWEADMVGDMLTQLSQALEQTSLDTPSLRQATFSSMGIHAALRLWLACLPSASSLATDSFAFPLSRISDIMSTLLIHPIWKIMETLSPLLVQYSSLLMRPLSALSHSYLYISKRLAGTSEDAWMSRALSTVLTLQKGDENHAEIIITDLIRMVNKSWLNARGMNAPDEFWQNGGVEVGRAFVLQRIHGQQDTDDRYKFIWPLQMAPADIQRTTTQRLRQPDSNTSGLPLRRDWMTYPIESILKAANSASAVISDEEVLVPSPWAASETDIVRATLLFTKITMILLKRGGPQGAAATLSREETILTCMKVYMLEHGIEDGNTHSEVFRDPIVSTLMRDLLGPHSYSASNHGGATENLETAAITWLGASTPFYQLYTDFVALYDAVSFSDPLFSRLLLPPTSMKYPADYRKLLWNDHGHLLKNIRTAVDDLLCDDIKDYLWPVEEDPQVMGAYLGALMRHGDALEGFVRLVAVHHVALNIWGDHVVDERAKILFLSVVKQASTSIIREVCLYLQPEGGFWLPPRCFESYDAKKKERRLQTAERWGGLKVAESLKGLF